MGIRFSYVDQRNSDTDRRTLPGEPMADFLDDPGSLLGLPGAATYGLPMRPVLAVAAWAQNQCSQRPTAISPTALRI